MDCRMVTRFSKMALPSKKNTLSGIPMAIFHRMIIIKSIMEARDPITMVKMSTGRNLQELKKFLIKI